MTFENQDIIQKSKTPKDAVHKYLLAQLLQLVACQTYCLGRLQVLFPDLAHSFTSCQLLVKDEH